MPIKKTVNRKTSKSLAAKDLKSFLKKYPDWSVNAAGDLLKREYKISNYIEGLTLLARVVVHAELLQHHPEVTLTYKKMIFKLTTHDTKSLSELDTDLALRIENILNQ